ncbi:hypothetical protein [Mycolicibacterium parafortuitum]|uniref:DUF732 domain-containing protein n=1 Tax=Mycolicibacterium parafortuitum TaxID=39692 RepID=A0A375YLY8_MYCPF|nr:hypothetical protein [Mycolicibacterium parafortuitum]SRX82177.1 hypothetical protein MPP7335_03937 [Mycolicibacterium parafortuitum]
MRIRTVAAALVCCVALTSTAVAQANPAVPMPVIEESAVRLCGEIQADPTRGGVVGGLMHLTDQGLDDIDGALVTIVAIHHTCPQYQDLIMQTLDPIAAEELCPERL